MDATHFHLVFTHAVVWLAIAGTILLAWGLIRKSADVRNVALGMVLVGGLLAIPVYLTGEEAEHTVEEYGVSDDVIHEHEESAELATVFLGGYGIFALGALFYLRKRAAAFPGKLVAVALILSFIPAGAMGWTANQGGKIRHPEITNSGAPAANGGADSEVAGHQRVAAMPEPLAAPRY